MADKRYTATNNDTGESVSFSWNKSTPPTEDDVSRISDQQRAARIAAKQKIQSLTEPSFTDKLLMHPAVGGLLKMGERLGLNNPVEGHLGKGDLQGAAAWSSPWHPIQGLQDVGEGMQHVVQGTQPGGGKPPVANPRTAGLMQAAHGAMGVVGYPLTIAGLTLAPEVTAPAMVGGSYAGEGAHKLLDSQTNLSPEVKDALSTGAGLIAGGAIGHGINKFQNPVAPESIPVKPPSQEVMRGRPARNFQDPPYRGNESVIINQGPRKLGPGGPMPGPVAPPSAPPARAPIITPEPEAPTPQFNVADNGRPTLPQGPQAPATLPSVRPPAGLLNQAPIEMGPALPTQLGPTPPRYDVRGTVDEPQARPNPPAPKAKPVETVAPNSPTDVSSVQSPTEEVAPAQAAAPTPPPPTPVPAVQTPPISSAPVPPPPQPPPSVQQMPAPPPAPPAAPPLRPPLASPPTPAPPAPEPPAPMPEPPPPPPAPAPAPTPAPAVAPKLNLKNVMPKVKPPIDPEAAAKIAANNQRMAEIQAQISKAQPPPEAPPPALPAPEPPPAPAPVAPAPGPVLPPVAAPPVPPPDASLASPATRSAASLAANAMLKAKVKPPVDTAPTDTLPSVNAPDDVPAISRAERAKAQLNNQVLDFFKNRVDVTPAQLQINLGIDGTAAKAVIKNLESRGLIRGKAGKYTYIRARGEELPGDVRREGPRTISGDPGPVAPPGAASGPEATPSPANGIQEPPTPTPETGENSVLSERSPGEQTVSPARRARMSDLQKQVGEAEDEGNDYQAGILRKHLEDEENAAEVERSGTPEQKTNLKERDDLYEQVKQLEDKESGGEDLTPEDTRALARAYKRINALEINHFFQSEEGSNPSTGRRPGDNSSRSFLGRWWYATKNIVPPPGFADIRGASAELGSPNRVLRESGIPGAVEIGKGTPMTEVEKYKWLGTTMREQADAIKGLTDEESRQVARAIDVPGAELDDLKNSNLPPKIKDAAVKLRVNLDKIHAMLPEDAGPNGEGVGYISGYMPRIAKLFADDNFFARTADDLIEHHLGAGLGLSELLTRTPAGVPKATTELPEAEHLGYGGIRDPNSPFNEQRLGQLQEYTHDLKRILPLYARMASKAIFDKPWIDEAREHLARIDKDEFPKAHALALDYLRNYADTEDGYAAIRSSWDKFTNPLMRMHARSLLGLSTRMFTLHLSRMATQMFTEVPIKYFMKGALKSIMNPIDTYIDLGRRGVLPSNLEPWAFKRAGAKMDAASNAFSTFDFAPDAVGWHGLNAMYKDQGFDPVTAGNMASDRVMDLSMRSTPARMQRMFDQHGPLRPLTQYKQQIFKIAEQLTVEPANALRTRQYGKFLKYVIGVGATIEIGKKLHLTTWHLNLHNMTDFGGGVYGSLGRAIYKASKGNIKGALQDVGLMTIPGSHEIKGLIEGKGPSAIEKEE